MPARHSASCPGALPPARVIHLPGPPLLSPPPRPSLSRPLRAHTCAPASRLQVDAIRNAAEPYTQSVRRMSHKVTHKVDEYMVKYNLSPAPKPHYR